MQTTRTPYSVSFMATVLLLFLFACHSTIANAAVALGATRVIYPANQKQVLLPVTNNDPASVYLIQSWIENAGDQKDTQFVITPPLFSMQGKKENTLRIINATNHQLPGDRESLFWVNVKAIPAMEKDQKNENTLQLAIISRIKMFYRPTHLAMAPEEAPAMLRFRRSGSILTLINPTPYFITVTNMKAGNSKFGIYLLLMAGKVFAFSCNVDGGSSIGAGTTSVYVNLDPVILPGQNLVVDLSQHISCWNDYGGWYDTDHINLVQGSAFAGSLQSYKGSLYWNNVTYPFPLTTNTNVLDIGDKTPMPLPLKLYITPVGAAGGVVIKSGEVIARIHMYKIATLGSGNPRNFTWNIISNNSVVMPTGGCTVDSRNVTVNLPDFPGSAEIPLGVYCSSEQKLSFYLSGATTDSARQVFANTAPDATKASGVGVSLMRNGKTLATGENVSLGTVNKSKVPLGLSATYGQTGNKVAAGAVQSVIGVTFIYE